jgi:hypothetical protein
MKKPNNPQAFPIANDKGFNSVNNSKGMTLLDYFAGQILKGTLSNDAFYYRLVTESKDSDLGRERYLAEHCYIYAKAMLEERENWL